MHNKNHLNPNPAQAGQIISVRATAAKQVFLAGAFNGWNPTSHPMTKAKSGEWALTLNLPPGEHEYKFIIDGQWCCEVGGDKPYNARPGHVPNEHGTMNRIIEVKSLDALEAVTHTHA